MTEEEVEANEKKTDKDDDEYEKKWRCTKSKKKNQQMHKLNTNT